VLFCVFSTHRTTHKTNERICTISLKAAVLLGLISGRAVVKKKKNKRILPHSHEYRMKILSNFNKVQVTP
jgi:hypothetical protein